MRHALRVHSPVMIPFLVFDNENRWWATAKWCNSDNVNRWNPGLSKGGKSAGTVWRLFHKQFPPDVLQFRTLSAFRRHVSFSFQRSCENSPLRVALSFFRPSLQALLRRVAASLDRQRALKQRLGIPEH
jgi:hypothetical protein